MYQMNLYHSDMWPADEYLSYVFEKVFGQKQSSSTEKSKALKQIVQKSLIVHLLELAASEECNPQVAAIAENMLLSRVIYQVKPKGRKNNSLPNNPASHDFKGIDHARAHETWILEQIFRYMNRPESFRKKRSQSLPPGSPIGCGF